MPKIHFLNVNQGDCSIIEHHSGRLTMIDVCNAKPIEAYAEAVKKIGAASEKGVLGNFNQKKYPVNPIAYMKERGWTDIFRFVLTHPDMDRMDGIEELFRQYSPTNFWDTDNTESKDDFSDGRYSEDDWNFYLSLRNGNPQSNPKRLTLHSGSVGQYFNRNENNEPGADGLHILAPTAELVTQANARGDYNDCSYVVLYRTGKHRILFAGDSHDATWDHILATHEADVKNVDILIAPHHGRDSDRSYEFLDTLKPALTLFGNADSDHLAYSAWNNRGLTKITNNQSGSVMIDAETDTIFVYVTCQPFAKQSNAFTFEHMLYKGFHFWGAVQRQQAMSA